MKFRSDQSGLITGLRFYKASTNTGTHVGNLWTSTGTLLATATFIGETTSGWQQVDFSPAIAITANITYVASYHTDVGHYSGDLNYFASAVDRAPLHALSSGSNGGNGVYAYGATSSFPTSSYMASNYWVDAVFGTRLPPAATPTSTPTPTASQTATITPTSPISTVIPVASPTATSTPTATATSTATTIPAPPTCPCSLFSGATMPSNPAGGHDANPVELGDEVPFRPVWIRLRHSLLQTPSNTGTHVVNLWTSAGTLLATAVVTGETASGWQQVSLPSQVAISANTTYVVSYHTNAGHYGADLNFFTVDVNNGVLHAPSSNSGGGNGVYLYGAASSFPRNSYSAANYWVDVVYHP